MGNENPKRILINKYDQLVRVALTEGKMLYDLEIEQPDFQQKVDDIYNAEVVSIERSLGAAFVNFGAKRNGFLPLKEIHFKDKQPKTNIADLLFVGQKILAQVIKEERGTKGAALSTYISLAGCYLVLMPNNSKAGGISRRIEGEERETLRNLLSSLKIPQGMGVIIRTAGIGRSLEELQWDLDTLLNLWESIQQASESYGAPYLIHQESDIAIRAIRDYLRPDIDEVLIDDQETFSKVRAYIERIRPDFLLRIKLYTQPAPLFSKFQIEKQIESVFQRKVHLPSGGEIVIDRTEALTAIDVNSAQATKGEYIEETALNTNLEAAKEIARQLRIRDLGGLFVIDFIDMEEEENNRKVEECLRVALRNDRARVQQIRISRFGLLEMSRQRLRSPLNETFQTVCPRCHGQGTIRNIPSQASSIIHLIQEMALKEKTTQIHVQVPINVATYLLNEKREVIKNIEKLYSLNVIVIPNPYIEMPQYKIETFPTSKGERPTDTKTPSYDLLTLPTLIYTPEPIKPVTQKPEPIIKDMLPLTPAPIKKQKKQTFLDTLKKVWHFLSSEELSKKKETKEIEKTEIKKHRRGKRMTPKSRSRRQYRPKTPQTHRQKTKSFETPRRSDTKRISSFKKVPQKEIKQEVKQIETKPQQNIVQPRPEKTAPVSRAPVVRKEPAEQLIMVETRKDKNNK